VVSCTIYRHITDFTCAKLNSYPLSYPHWI
jgi:hypothetical protein